MIGVFYMFWVSVHGASESRGIELFGQRLLLGHGVGMSGVNLQKVFFGMWTRGAFDQCTKHIFL